MVKPLWRIVWRFLKKLKIELLNDPVIPRLGINMKKMKTLIQKNTCTPVFIEALFTIAKTWKQPKCSRVKWTKKMWCVCVCVGVGVWVYAYLKLQHMYIYVKFLYTHTHTMEYYLAIKRMKYCHLEQHGSA